MTYQPFDPTKPYGGDSGPDIPAKANINDCALRDAIVMGLMRGFTFITAGGTAAQPAAIAWVNGTTVIQAIPTWGSGAGQDGNVTALVWNLSHDSGSTFDTIATSTFTFDTSGNLTAASNSSWLAWIMSLMGKVYKSGGDIATHTSASGTSVHGLGTLSTQNANAVAITGGSISCDYEREKKTALGNVSTSTTLDWRAGLYTLTVTGASAALTFSNLPSGSVGYLTIEVTNGAIATSLISCLKPGGIAISWTNPGTDIITLRCHDGSTVRMCGFEKDSK
jgi:hypothetical protein